MSHNMWIFITVVGYGVLTVSMMFFVRYKLSRSGLVYLAPLTMVVITGCLIVLLKHPGEIGFLVRVGQDRELFADALTHAFMTIWAAMLGASILITGVQRRGESEVDMSSFDSCEVKRHRVFVSLFDKKELAGIERVLGYKSPNESKMFFLGYLKHLSPLCGYLVILFIMTAAAAFYLDLFWFLMASVALLLLAFIVFDYKGWLPFYGFSKWCDEYLSEEYKRGVNLLLEAIMKMEKEVRVPLVSVLYSIILKLQQRMAAAKFLLMSVPLLVVASLLVPLDIKFKIEYYFSVFAAYLIVALVAVVLRVYIFHYAYLMALIEESLRSSPDFKKYS